MRNVRAVGHSAEVRDRGDRTGGRWVAVPAGGPPGPMAAVNTLLNAAPPRLREALLTGFLSLLQHP